MIPLAFEYHRPATAGEAVAIFRDLADRGREPLWYGGGTEILSLARLGRIRTGAVVDLKAVPECRRLGRDGGKGQDGGDRQDCGELVFGAGVTLAELCERDVWPLLSDAAGRVADHTSRCRITLGGNLAGRIRYREAALPFLLVDAVAVNAGEGGLRRAPFADVFDGTLRLGNGEFLAQVRVPVAEARGAHACVKKTRLDWVDYPLVTVAALRRDGRVRAAFSGLTETPFRSRAMEDALNDRGLARRERAIAAVERIPGDMADDIHGSAAYRRFVLARTLEDILERLEAVEA